MNKRDNQNKNLSNRKGLGLKRNKQLGAYKRVLAIFVNFYPRTLKPAEIAKLTSLNYNTVRVVIHRLYKEGFLQRLGRGFYSLKNKEIAIRILNDKRFKIRLEPKVFETNYINYIDGQKNIEKYRDWWRRYIDLDNAMFEHSELRFRVIRSVAEKIRSMGKWKKNDRSKQVSIRKNSFTLVISKFGTIRLFIRDPFAWPKELIAFLHVDVGLTEREIRHFMTQLKDSIPKSKATIEVPVVNRNIDSLRGLKIETRVGDKVLVTRFSGSHFVNEMETSGDTDIVISFLAALSGVQHFSALEWIQAQELSDINKKFGILADGFQRLADALQQSVRPVQQHFMTQQKESDNSQDIAFT